MAGIIATSASKVMVSGDTSAEDVESGYITNEQIALSVTPSGSTYSWNQSVPTSSAPGRSRLTSDDAATSRFTPDVPGMYVVTCLVNGVTFYVLRLSVTSLAVSQFVEALRFSPIADANVPAPAAGRMVYFSSDQDALVAKDPDDNLFTIDVTAIP
jgi:hypothetical protein